MKHEKLDSTAIESTAHDPDTNTAEIYFKSGRKYRVLGITAEQHDALRNADSAGKHFNSQIKGNFTVQPIEDDTETDRG